MDPYKAALGLDQSASREEIKRAYRKLALQFHPDKHSHSSDSIRDRASLRFKFVSQAYEGLMDELKRSDNNRGSRNNDYTNSCPNYQSSSSSSNNGRSSSNNYNSNDNGRRSYSRCRYRFSCKDAWIWKWVLLLKIGPLIVAGGWMAIDYGSWKMKNPGKSYEDYEDYRRELKEKQIRASIRKSL